MTTTIDLIDRYGARNIEGADRGDIRRALSGRYSEDSRESQPVFVLGDNTQQGASLVHVATGRKIVLGCVREYFEPKKDYFKLNSKSECSFVQRALELPNPEYRHKHCALCMVQCLDYQHKIKPTKLRIAGSYFLK